MAKFELLPVLLSFLYIWILFSPSLGQEEAAGPLDTEHVPGVDSESNMTASNTSSGNVTTGEEIVDINRSPMNSTDLDISTTTNVTTGTGNATSTTDDLSTNSSLVNTTSGSVSIDGNTTLSDKSTLNLSDVNSTTLENSTFADNVTKLSDSNATISDNNATLSDSNTTISHDNMTSSDLNATSSVYNSTMSDERTMFNNMTMSENMAMSENMTMSGKMTMSENMTSENMTAVKGDDLFSVNVTTNNETDIVIGGSMNSTFSVDSNVTSPSDSGSGIDTSKSDTSMGTSGTDTGTGTSGTDTGTGTSGTGTGKGTSGIDTGLGTGGFGEDTGAFPFDNPPSGGVDPFEDPFGNPFGDITDSGDPFGEDPFGPENPTFDLCTEPPCEPAVLPTTTPRPVTQPPPPPPPPPPAAATKGFDRLFSDQEKFELKRLPNFAFPPSNTETQNKQNRQDAFEELRKNRIARLQALFSSFNAGVPAAGGLNFFNPSKEFSSITQNAGNQINFQNSGLNQRENRNQFPNDNNIFRRRENTANSNNNNLNIANSNAHITSESIIEQPAKTVRPFNPPPSPKPDPATPARTRGFNFKENGVVPDGVAPPPPPPPQLDKSINRDSTFIKFFGQIGTSEPGSSKIGSTNTVNTNTNSANTNNNFANSNNNFANTNTNFANTNNNFANPNNNFANTNTNFANTNTNFAGTNTNFANKHTNSANRKTQSTNVNIGTINTEKQPFAWPYQVPGSSGKSTSSKTASARRVVSSVVNEGSALSSWLDTTPFLSDSAGGRVIDTSVMSSISSSNAINKKSGGQAASRIGIPFVGLGDLDTFNIKERPANTVEIPSSGGSTTLTGRTDSPSVGPGVPMNADTSFQSPPMNVNINPFSARRPGVPAWDRTDPALVEFGAASRSSMPFKNLADTWRSAQLPMTSSKRSQNSRSSEIKQNKPPTRDPPFIFKPKPSSNLGRNIFDNRRQSSTSNVQQPPPPPSKTETSLFNPSKFEQPPPPRNLPFSNINVEQSGGIPPPPPGRIGYDPSEIFAKIAGASFGRSGTGESVITTKRSPRFLEDKLSAMNSDPVWDNTFFNQPAVKKNPTVRHKPFVLPSAPMNFPPAAENNANPFQNNYPPESFKIEKIPDIFELVTKTEEAQTTTMFPETTTMDAIPSSVDPLLDYATATTVPDSTPGEVSFTTDIINIPTETTTTMVPIDIMNEYLTTTVPVVEFSIDPLIDLHGSSTQTSASSKFTTSGTATSSNMLNQMSNQPDPTPVVHQTEPLLTIEAQPADGQTKLREFNNAAEICRNCNFINGYCRLELPGNCNRFIECSKHDREVRAFEKECSHGLFWHQGNLTCERPLRVKCEFDPCLNRGVSNHTYIGKCRAYWSCKRSYSSARCCAKGYGYGLQDGTYGCIPMPDCQDDGHCMSKEERANLTLINANKPRVCTLMADPTDPFKYIRGAHTLPCAPGTRFDQEECTCITSQAAPISTECAKDMYLDFEGVGAESFKDRSGRGNTVHEKNVRTDNEGIAKFEKNGIITLWKYSNQNIGSSIAITFRFLSYRYTSRMQTLLSNCDQSTGIAAIDITLDTQKSVVNFKIETTQSPGNKITLPYKPLTWNNVTLIYDGGSFVAAVDDAFELMFIQGEIPSKHPPLVIGGCSAKTKEGLLGLVDDVSIYNGCIPEDLKSNYHFARK